MTNLFLVTSFYWRLFVKMICITLKWNWFFGRLCVCVCGSLDFSFISFAANWLFNHFMCRCVGWLGSFQRFEPCNNVALIGKWKYFRSREKIAWNSPLNPDQERTKTILKIIKLSSIELIDILRVRRFVFMALLWVFELGAADDLAGGVNCGG